MIAYFLGVPFIALYIDYFVQRLRRAQHESEQRADEVTRLLGFVAHDIRTPLQSLLSTIETTRAGSQEAGTQLRLGRMEQAVQVLARMATDVLSTARSPLAAPARTALPTYGWFIGVVDIFRDEFARQGTQLAFDLDYTLPPMIHPRPAGCGTATAECAVERGAARRGGRSPRRTRCHRCRRHRALPGLHDRQPRRALARDGTERARAVIDAAWRRPRSARR